LTVGNVVELHPQTGRDQVENDFETARANLLAIVEAGQISIESLAQLADQSQNDKYYLALAALMRTIVDANEKLLDIQKKIRNVTAETKEGAQTIHNNLIITTDELRKIIKESND
jgi:flagellar biosynthesis regulator FlbT